MMLLDYFDTECVEKLATELALAPDYVEYTVHDMLADLVSEQVKLDPRGLSDMQRHHFWVEAEAFFNEFGAGDPMRVLFKYLNWGRK